MGGQNKAIDGLKQAYRGLRDDPGMMTETTVVPITAAVVIKTFCKKGLQLIHTSDLVPDGPVDIIRKHQHRFNTFDLASKQEALGFVDFMNFGFLHLHGQVKIGHLR